MKKSGVDCGVTPHSSDIVGQSSAHTLSIIPHHTVQIISSISERGTLKHVDSQGRTHYLKLECKIIDSAGVTVQVCNRFIFLSPKLGLDKPPFSS